MDFDKLDPNGTQLHRAEAIVNVGFGFCLM